MAGEMEALFALTRDLSRATGRDAYVLDKWGQVVCKNGEQAWGLPEGEMAMAALAGAGQIAVSVGGLNPERHGALHTTVRAYALLAALGRGGDKGDSLFASVHDHILAHLRDDLSGDALAQALYVSRSTVARAVKAGAGLPLRLYIQSVRLDAAQALLINGDLTITQVAAQCGISDFNYFSRIYKKRFGLTPTQARSQSRSQSRF